MSQKPNTHIRVQMQVHGEWRNSPPMAPRKFETDALARRFVVAQLRWLVGLLEMDTIAMRDANMEMLRTDPLLDPELREEALASGVRMPPYPVSDLAALDATVTDPRDPWDDYLQHQTDKHIAAREVSP